MLNYPKRIFEGAGIGLLAGLLIGLTNSDWIRLILVLALIAFTSQSLKNFISKAETPTGQSFTGIAAFLAVMVGLYLNGHQTFKQSPAEVVNKYIKAGFSPGEARALYLKQWEWGNQKDSEPSAAMQAIIKTILEKSTDRDVGPVDENNSIVNTSDSLQSDLPMNGEGESANPAENQ